MENQYNYYTTDQNMNTGNYGGGGEPGKEPQKKRGKGAARWAKLVCAGLVFGVVASAAFQPAYSPMLRYDDHEFHPDK